MSIVDYNSTFDFGVDFKTNESAELSELLYEKIKSKFYTDVKRLSRFVEDHFNEAEAFFFRASSVILASQPSNIILSLTDSKSLHFKIYNGPNFETHLEVFYCPESEDDNIESVISIFENDREVYKNYGGLDFILQEFYKFIGCTVESFPTEEFEESVTSI